MEVLHSWEERYGLLERISVSILAMRLFAWPWWSPPESSHLPDPLSSCSLPAPRKIKAPLGLCSLLPGLPRRPATQKTRATTWRKPLFGAQIQAQSTAGFGFGNVFQVRPEPPLNVPHDFVQTAGLIVKPRQSGLTPSVAEPPLALAWAGRGQAEQETPHHREGSTVRKSWVYSGSCDFLVEWTWASDFISLGLRLCICKMRMTSLEFMEKFTEMITASHQSLNKSSARVSKTTPLVGLKDGVFVHVG